MPEDDPEIDRIQAHWHANWRHKRRWTIVEEIDGTYSVHDHSSDGVGPPSSYPDKVLAAARVLQLLGLKEPVTPQDYPERVCVGTMTTAEDCGDEGEDE
jgi:hypothetical protein